jgi:peptidoglycan/LPS O-acetylase OafA/YrhL
MDINGAVWTIYLEIKLYLILPLLFYVGVSRYRWSSIILFLLYTAVIITVPSRTLARFANIHFFIWYDLGYKFFIGAMLFFWKEKIPISWKGIVLLAICWWLSSIHFGAAAEPVFKSLFFVYSVIWVGLSLPVLYQPRNDLSYSIYLYGSPVQHLVSYLTNSNLNLLQFLVVTVPITLACAWFSWSLIEKKALSWKKYFQ